MSQITRTITLNENEREFLDKFLKRDENRKMLLTGTTMPKRDSFSIIAKKNEAEKIVDELSDLLVEYGLKKDEEPNDLGVLIEHLIDIFNPYKWE